MPDKITRVRRQRKIKPFHGFEQLLRPATLAILIGSLVFLIALGLIFFTYGARVYSDWREGHLLKLATKLLHEQKYNEATRVAQDVVNIDPDSLPAFYILAEAAEKQSDTDSLPTFYTLAEATEQTKPRCRHCLARPNRTAASSRSRKSVESGIGRAALWAARYRA